MNTVLTFVTIIAWVAALVSTILCCLFVRASAAYNKSLTKIADEVRGVRRHYPIARYFCIAVLAWSWLIARWIG